MKQMVVQFKVVDYNTFCDLNDWEVMTLLNCIPFAFKEYWEISRFLAYNIISPYMSEGSRDKSIMELFPLPTDDEIKEEAQNITDEQITSLKQKGQSLAQLL